ncbi:MAG: hypothetical protein A3I32_02495 [Candidatus Yanofskybacteria bacterium RIFCSPLOWO2_02_FULL_45_10]|nr:MAG: hypothetical protein A3F25_00290 [Candidatus Yanofskybacteria bacterium RIFCSPHIGHO2_12_FULL_45_19b]OGN32244.1 MAG: hypothetical protein A3I32_02495 [Candidatus Yanofskybacteria bacterium RIFCSPLOWO2_02_FULL_45_10]
MLVSLVLSFIIFGNGIKGGFVLDDTVVVEKRGELRKLENFFTLFISPYHQNAPYTGLFRPVTMASYALNFALLGRGPSGFHLVNIILHALNVVLVFVVTHKLLKHKRPAIFAALLFLAHPLHVEAVTSIVGRAELLAFLGSLLAIIFALERRWWWMILAFFLAILSKESALAVLPIILYLWRWQQGQSWSWLVKNSSRFLLALAPYFLLRYLALGQYLFKSGSVSFVENPLKFMDLGERIANALMVFWLYLTKLFWPVKLSADYSYNSIPLVKNLLTSWQASVGLVLLLGLIGLLVFKRKVGYGQAAGIFVFPYLVVANLFFPVGTIMGERLLYLPSLGVIIMVAWLLEQGLSKLSTRRYQKFFYGGLAVVLLVLSYLTIQRNQVWQSNASLLSAVSQVNPNSVIAQTGLAAIALTKDDLTETTKRLAIANTIYPGYAPLQNLQGIVAVKTGNLVAAEKHYLRAVELNPRSLNAYNNLVSLYLSQKNYTRAAQYLEKVIQLSPTQEQVTRYGQVLLMLGRSEEAARMIDWAKKMVK